MKVEIEFGFVVGNKMLLCGWIIVSEELTKNSLTFDLSKDEDTVLFTRNDVCKVMNCPKSHSSGFLVCIDNYNRDEVEVQWGEEYQVLPTAEMTFVNQLLKIEELPEDSVEKASSLLEKNGFYWGQKTNKDSIAADNNLRLSLQHSKFEIDYAFMLDANTVLVIGWVLDRAQLFKRINLRINNTITDNILDDAFFHPRYDVCEVLGLPLSDGEQSGFIFTVSVPSTLDTNMELIYSVDGTFFTGVPIKAKVLAREETWLTKMLLYNINATTIASDPKLYKHVTPAIEKSWHSRLVAPNSATVTQFGSAVVNPKLSLIIPIYGRYDFVQIQMSQFSIDAQMADIEIVYVLDDPRIKHPFMVTCHGVYETFGVPFKTVVSQRNLGYAGANNLGVDHANAEHIILMNSDVIPKQPGRFFKMLGQFKASEDIGILGGTLLYEDNTIQHQGMEYMQDPSHPGMWMNYHPQKGFPLSLTDEFDIRDAQAVTGALMLMTKQQYIDVGGFDIGYILGDFEDSDLCMKVRNQNKRIAVSGVVQMYHLERLSQSLVSGNTWKHTLSMLNGLRHTNKWNDRIVEVMAENE